MPKYIKTGILIILLVVPVLIFIFLKGFTTNQYGLPYYVPLRDSVTNEIVISKGDTTFYQIGPFSLRTADNNTISHRDLQGKTLVVGTVPAPCTDTCSKVIGQLARAGALHSSSFPVEVLIVPESENTALLATANQQRRETGWHLLAGSDSVLNYHLQTTFRLTENVPGMPYMPIRTRCCLIDSKGYIRGYYDASNPEDVDRLLAEIKILEYNMNLKE